MRRSGWVLALLVVLGAGVPPAASVEPEPSASSSEPSPSPTEDPPSETPSPTASASPTPTPTASASPTPTPTASASPTPSPTPTPTSTSVTSGGAALSVTVPSQASLGSAPAGGTTLTGQLGPVTVRASATGGLLGAVGSVSWRATVTATDFTTGGGTAVETVPATALGYRSGPATAMTGLSTTLCSPGQPAAAAPLGGSTPLQAFACGGVALLSSTSVTWQPEITIAPRPENVAGTYTGTITHSVF